MDDVLADVQFLANSANRVQVLEALAAGPATRRELQDETGVPRSTAARVLDEAADHGWVRSEGSRYRITPLGTVMISEFRSYVETIEGVHHLGPAVDWLPEPVRDLDFRYFRDADVTTPTDENPTAPFDRGMKLVRTADEYRGLTQNSLPQYMEAICDRVARGDLDFQGVIEADFIDVLREDPDRAARWHDIAHGMWVYGDRIPINMHVIDERALIWLCEETQAGDDALVKGLLESEHPAVVSWADSLYEEYRAKAEPLDPAVLPPD